ncbi:MAG: hypothetical protein M3N22_08810 [Acidobacteriota bacterium]|nr:hypothetical protein [Acidobacteriota bacterium]
MLILEREARGVSENRKEKCGEEQRVDDGLRQLRPDKWFATQDGDIGVREKEKEKGDKKDGERVEMNSFRQSAME